MNLSPNGSLSISHNVTNPKLDPIYVNDATVTVTIKDSKGADTIDESWPVILPYISGSNGDYEKSFDPFTNLIVGNIYTVIINVTGIDGLIDYCEHECRALRKIC